jgi:prepilin-type N-terminal cleavage/methylation domain-containing protein
VVVIMPSCSHRQRGLTLVELLLAVVISAIVFAGLESVVTLGLKAQASGRKANDIAYQAGFVLDRLAARIRTSPPKLLTPAAAGTTGDWLAPVMYCFRPGKKLTETTPADVNCNSGTVIANDVVAFSAQPLSSARPAITFTITFDSSTAPEPVTATFTMRLGGGAL